MITCANQIVTSEDLFVFFEKLEEVTLHVYGNWRSTPLVDPTIANMKAQIEYGFFNGVLRLMYNYYPTIDLDYRHVWNKFTSTYKFYIKPKQTIADEQDQRFLYGEIYVKGLKLVGYRFQVENVNDYLHLTWKDTLIRKIEGHIKRLATLVKDPYSPDMGKHLNGLEEAFQDLYNIFEYNNDYVYDMGSKFYHYLKKTLSEITFKRAYMTWDSKTNRIHLTFKKFDKRTTLSFDISFKWFKNIQVLKEE